MLHLVVALPLQQKALADRANLAERLLDILADQVIAESPDEDSLGVQLPFLLHH